MNKTLQLTLAICAVLANVIYIIWRICFTIPSDTNFLSLFFAIGLLCAELLGIFELFVYLHGATNAVSPALPEVENSDFPDVDVFIATYNEPVELLRKTIIGCKNMKYPSGKCVHIFLCDDGNRIEMSKLALELNIHYLNRNNNHGAKAGNLNNALKYSHAPLIATFDADMIPMEDFLLETVPYFLDEQKKIGFVQTPQCFYNADLFQSKLYSKSRIPNEQDYFYRNVQLTKNRTNTVIYGGSNTVIARQALEDVGGFYEDSITEDFATGILIQSKGYQCHATDKPLASGLSPNDLKSLMKQRERWARGCIQTIKQLNIYFLKGLTFPQKISYTSAISYWFAPLKRFFYIMSPIAFTVFGVRVIDATLFQIMLFFIPTYTITNFAIKGFCNNIRNSRWTNIYETITFPTLIKCVLLETLGISEQAFSVTSKSKSNDVDRNYHYKRATPFYFYIGLSIIGIVNVFIYMPQYTTLNFVVLLFWLITNLLYLILALLFVLEFNQNNTDICYHEHLDFHFMNDTVNLYATTTEISDTYLKFQLDNHKSLKKGTVLHACFCESNSSTDDYCKFQVQVSAAVSDSNYTEYTCNIVDISQEHHDLWNRILHNRLPSIPQTIVDSKHIFHDLFVNLRARRS